MKRQRISFLNAIIGMMKAETDEDFDRYMRSFSRMMDKMLMSVLLVIALGFSVSGFWFTSSALDCIARFGLGGSTIAFAIVCLAKLNRSKRCSA